MSGRLDGRVSFGSRPASRPVFRPDEVAAGTPPTCDDGTWAAIASAPFASPLCAYPIGVNMYVLFTGGDFASYRWDTDTWTTLASPPVSISTPGGLSGGSGASDIIMYGSDGAGTGYTIRYDGGADTWDAPGVLATMPTVRHDVAVTVGSRVYVIGGTVDGGADSTAFEEYRISFDAWTTKASLDIPIKKAGAAQGANGIYLWGVDSGGNNVGRKWDKTLNAWSALPPPPWTITREYPIVSVMVEGGFRLFLIGGGTASDSTDFWTFDPITESYTPTGSSSTANLQAGFQVLSGGAYTVNAVSYGHAGASERYSC